MTAPTDNSAGFDLAVCVPTYRRATLLIRLLGDLSRQSVAIDRLIVVDGDPASGEVPAALAAATCEARELVYVPSNHANLPYQRFLGWRAASGTRWLLYLDDDMRLLSPDSAKKLVDPLRAAHGQVVGTTAEFETGHSPHQGKGAPPASAQRRRLCLPALARAFGSAARIAPGGLSPAGHRRPLIDRGEPYEVTGCLRGGAMAYRMDAVTADCFSDALFAMGERGWGLGEDTLLSRRVGLRGVLLAAFHSGIVHPNEHPTVAYRREAFGRGYAAAFSRRLLNDHFRGFEAPRPIDRFWLAQSYTANVMLGWLGVVRRPGWRRCASATGYTVGAIRGLLQSPESRRLTPGVDWWRDAEAALAQTRVLSPKPAWVH